MVKNILQELQNNYTTQKNAAQAFIDLEARAELAKIEGHKPDISRAEADRLAHGAFNAEINIQSAIKQYEALKRFDIKSIEEILMIDLQPYAYADIRVSKSPKYEDLAKRVAQEGSQISCGIVYRDTMLDPQYPNNWSELGIKSGDAVRLYLRNHGEHALKDFAKYIGKIIKKEDRVSAQKIKLPKNTREFGICNQYGIHARPAALFVKAASKFDCDISVEKDGQKVSGKSIMGMMTLEATKGSNITVNAKGSDAEDCLDELQALVESKFGED